MMNTTTATMIEQARGQVAQYPQYERTFDGARAAVALRDVRTKAGLAMVRGEIVLVMKDHAARPGGRSPGFATIWSMRNACLTSVRKADLAATVRIDSLEDGSSDECELADFLDADADALAPADLDALRAGWVVSFGGGAAPCATARLVAHR